MKFIFVIFLKIIHIIFYYYYKYIWLVFINFKAGYFPYTQMLRLSLVPRLVLHLNDRQLRLNLHS